MSQPGTITIIEPTGGWRFINWRELWAYRDLLRLLIWRDFTARYRQTILGPLWYVFQPLLMTLVFSVVFAKFAKIPTDAVPPTLFYLCGLLPWSYFAQTFQNCSDTLNVNAGIFGKVYFPRLIVPLANIFSNLLNFSVQVLTFAAFYIGFKLTGHGESFGLSSDAFLLPFVILQVALTSLGIGLCMSSLTAKFRDLQVLSSFLVQLWMYLTPLIYPLSQVPARWRPYAQLNPMAFPVEFFRHALLGTPAPGASFAAISLSITVGFFIAGIYLFRRVEKTFVDVA
jgi:lipopolysaccharide transport system permease protein